MNAAIWDENKEWSTGPMEDTIDDPEYATGWIWTCCNGDGYYDGCIPRPHKGTKFPDGLSALLENQSGGEDGPDSKHQKVDESGKKSSNIVIDLVDEDPKEPENEEKPRPKAQEVIVLSDSSDAEGESEEDYDEEDLENIETCTVCRQEYNSEDGDQECLSHDGML